MDFNLITFVTVAEKENFTRAAEALHITQSAVSLSIKALEKKYEVKLFERSNKRVRLTKAGEIIYHHSKYILNQYDRMNRLIEDLYHSPRGPLNIGASYTFGEYLLPRILAKFIRIHPLIKPTISIQNSDRVVSKLLDGEIDLGIVEGIEEHPDLKIVPFAVDEMVVIVSRHHLLANKSEVELKELIKDTWIISEEGSGNCRVIDSLFLKNEFFPATISCLGSSQIIKEFVESGFGISIVSKHAIKKDLKMGTLKTLRIRDYHITRCFSYAIPKIDIQPKVTNLLTTFLQDYPIE